MIDIAHTWEQAIPAADGISVEVFEAGWHAYLVEAYGIDRAALE